MFSPKKLPLFTLISGGPDGTFCPFTSRISPGINWQFLWENVLNFLEENLLLSVAL